MEDGSEGELQAPLETKAVDEQAQQIDAPVTEAGTIEAVSSRGSGSDAVACTESKGNAVGRDDDESSAQETLVEPESVTKPHTPQVDQSKVAESPESNVRPQDKLEAIEGEDDASIVPLKAEKATEMRSAMAKIAVKKESVQDTHVSEGATRDVLQPVLPPAKVRAQARVAFKSEVDHVLDQQDKPQQQDLAAMAVGTDDTYGTADGSEQGTSAPSTSTKDKGERAAIQGTDVGSGTEDEDHSDTPSAQPEALSPTQSTGSDESEARAGNTAAVASKKIPERLSRLRAPTKLPKVKRASDGGHGQDSTVTDALDHEHDPDATASAPNAHDRASAQSSSELATRHGVLKAPEDRDDGDMDVGVLAQEQPIDEHVAKTPESGVELAPATCASSGDVPTPSATFLPSRVVDTLSSTDSSELFTAQHDSIRVVIRARPMSESEKRNSKEYVRVLDDAQTVAVIQDELSPPRSFTFHRAMGAGASQEEFFNGCGIKSLINRAMEGYSCTAFAFGQTGSGKTHTLTGPESAETPGIIQLGIEYLWHRIRSASVEDTRFSLRASYLEIYNEHVLDLLNIHSKRGSLPVRWKADKGFHVENLFVMECADASDMLGVLQEGMKHRTSAAHEMNERSSRSHAILTVYIDSAVMVVDEEQQSTLTHRHGSISFVDLAGSERVDRTKAEGQTLVESNNINKSLLTLGNCISSLADPRKRKGHIPYRDSTLTMLLKDSLGGTGMTLMIACISPDSISIQETQNTLRYASRAKRIQNRPIVQMDPQEQMIQALKREVRMLRTECTYLRNQIDDGRDFLTSAGSVLGQLSTAGAPLPDTSQLSDAAEAVSALARELTQARVLLQQYMQENEDLRLENVQLFQQHRVFQVQYEALEQENQALIQQFAATKLQLERQGQAIKRNGSYASRFKASPQSIKSSNGYFSATSYTPSEELDEAATFVPRSTGYQYMGAPIPSPDADQLFVSADFRRAPSPLTSSQTQRQRQQPQPPAHQTARASYGAHHQQVETLPDKHGKQMQPHQQSKTPQKKQAQQKSSKHKLPRPPKGPTAKPKAASYGYGSAQQSTPAGAQRQRQRGGYGSSSRLSKGTASGVSGPRRQGYARALKAQGPDPLPDSLASLPRSPSLRTGRDQPMGLSLQGTESIDEQIARVERELSQLSSMA
eukprot:m.288360 g.288360  ORF g.288360 m.288360 type:complete len:1166 (-) comp15802_c0_seq2:474-3971(-)